MSLKVPQFIFAFWAGELCEQFSISTRWRRATNSHFVHCCSGRLPQFPPWRNPAEFALEAPPRPVVNGRQQGAIIAIPDLNWSWCCFSSPAVAVVKHLPWQPVHRAGTSLGADSEHQGRGGKPRWRRRRRRRRGGRRAEGRRGRVVATFR